MSPLKHKVNDAENSQRIQKVLHGTQWGPGLWPIMLCWWVKTNLLDQYTGADDERPEMKADWEQVRLGVADWTSPKLKQKVRVLWDSCEEIWDPHKLFKTTLQMSCTNWDYWDTTFIILYIEHTEVQTHLNIKNQTKSYLMLDLTSTKTLSQTYSKCVCMCVLPWLTAQAQI